MFYLKRRLNETLASAGARPGKWGMGQLLTWNGQKKSPNQWIRCCKCGSQFQPAFLGIIFHKFATLTCKTAKLLTIYSLILLTWKLKAGRFWLLSRKEVHSKTTKLEARSEKKSSASADLKGHSSLPHSAPAYKRPVYAFHNVYVRPALW